MKAQIALESILIYTITLIALSLILSSILFLNNLAIKAIEKNYIVKEKALIRDIVSEVCMLGNGVRFKIKVKYSHEIDVEKLGCQGYLELKEGKEYIISNNQGVILAILD